MSSYSGYTADFNWDFILDKIEEGECLLVLGPEAFCSESGTSYHDELVAYLNPIQNKNIHRYYEDDGFFLFDDLSKQTLVCHEIKAFYRKAVPSSTLLRIAEIPFHVVLTVTSDKLLNQAFDLQGFTHQFGHYKKHKDPQDIKAPTKQNPLLYNIFGCLDSEESLILTHNDLYDYFKSIFARKSMPQLLKDELRHIRNILFLGVPFDKWYMQLLLRELEIHRDGYAFIRFAANQSLPGETRTFCTEQFKINFIFDKNSNDQSTITTFVMDLYERCRERNLLRERGEKSQSPIEKIRHAVSDGKLEDALNLLEDATRGTEIENDVTILAGKYRNLIRRDLNNLLRAEEKDFQETTIAEGVLQLAERLRN